MKNFLSKFDKLISGFAGIFILFSIIFLDEILSMKYGGNLGGFLWTTFHFVLNPIFCLIYAIFTAIKLTRSKLKILKIFYLFFIVISLSYIYIAYAYPIEWIKMIGINFQK